jgi:hypothetical protein
MVLFERHQIFINVTIIIKIYIFETGAEVCSPYSAS